MFTKFYTDERPFDMTDYLIDNAEKNIETIIIHNENNNSEISIHYYGLLVYCLASGNLNKFNPDIVNYIDKYGYKAFLCYKSILDENVQYNSVMYISNLIEEICLLITPVKTNRTLIYEKLDKMNLNKNRNKLDAELVNFLDSFIIDLEDVTFNTTTWEYFYTKYRNSLLKKYIKPLHYKNIMELIEKNEN